MFSVRAHTLCVERVKTSPLKIEIKDVPPTAKKSFCGQDLVLRFIFLFFLAFFGVLKQFILDRIHKR